MVTPIRSSETDPQTQRDSMKALVGAMRSFKAGRVSSAVLHDTPTPGGILKALHKAYEPLGYEMPWEILDYVELLAKFNPDYSQAVENIKMIANSGHELIIDAASELRRRRAKEILEFNARNIQESHGGIDGIIDKLLDQAATYGAMCGEWILSDDLTQVVDFADLNPKVIRYFWEEDEQRFMPYQKVSHQQAKEAAASGQKVKGNCIQLNEITFRYYAFNAAPGSPYGVPPFVAALVNIGIQQDIVLNLAQIVKKIGLLGIVDLSVEQIPKLPGESDEQYQARATAYLDSYVEVIEAMVRDGGIVHFDDATVATTQIGGNAAGATNIHKANEEMIFSGLKSMPSVQGRSYSTTETYAGIAYDIVLRNTLKYQRAVKRMVESGYWLMIALASEEVEKINIQFNKNRTLDRLQAAQAEQVEITNVARKWAMGFLDQTGAGQELGYAQPIREMELPPEEAFKVPGLKSDDDPDEGDDFDSPNVGEDTIGEEGVVDVGEVSGEPE